MGNRLTLPLLFLAALLAGGAFFWMTGEERRSGPGARGGDAQAAPTGERPPAELAAPATLPEETRPAPEAPARVELAKSEEGRPAPAAKSPKAFGLRGKVVDRFGTPIAGARVTIAADTGFPLDLGLERELPWMKRQRAETDAEGRFALERVEPGSFQVAVRADGFAPFAQNGLALPASDTELEPFTLVRGAILAGIVVDPDGRGVAGAKLLSEEVDGPRDLFLVGEREPSAVTGADGRFRIETLACGAWRFRVRSADHPDLTVEGIAEEPVEQAGLRWQLAPGATIAGTVTGVPAAERGALEVRAARGSGGHEDDFFLGLGSARAAKVADNGTFVVRGLEIGQSYSLEARRAEFQEDNFWQRSRSNSVQATAGDSGVVLAYQSEAAVVFTVYDGVTRQPLEKFEVESGLDWPMPLRDDDGRQRRVFPGGAVRVGGLRPASEQDRVQLKVSATGYRDYERADIAVRAGQELDLGAVYLDPVPVVRVRVLDQEGAPVAGANVRVQKQEAGNFQVKRSLAISEDEGLESIEFGDGRTGTTDAAGWAAITSFEGETVDLSARAQGYAPGKLSGVFLPRGESIEQELRLTLGGEVLVHVLDAQGAPLPGARVEHRAAAAAGDGMFVLGGAHAPGEVTDAAGEVVFTNLAPGEHSFRLAEKEGGGMFHSMDAVVVVPGMGGGDGDEWSRVQVGEGERSEVTLRAAPRASLAGRVREAGKVLAGATLSLEKEKSGGGPRRPMLPGMESGPEGKSDGEGRYEIEDVKEGRYTLRVEHPTRRMPQEFPLELREGENSFDVELTVSVVAGRVVDEKGTGIAGVRVWPERRAGDGGPQMRFRMVMLDDSGDGAVMDSGQFGERAYTDAEGRYTLRGVTSDVDLVIKAEGDSVQPGSSDVVRVAPDEVKEGVDLSLSAAGKILVEAKLPDGSPARMQLVQAEYLGEAEPAVEPKFAFLQQGSTELKGLKPGRWKVNVRSAQGAPNDANSGQDQEIEVEPSATATATFEVE